MLLLYGVKRYFERTEWMLDLFFTCWLSQIDDRSRASVYVDRRRATAAAAAAASEDEMKTIEFL